MRDHRKNLLALGESRFASKILLVTLATISLPILIAVFFVLSHISELLHEDTEEALLRNSKFFALHVFDKLITADDELNLFVSDALLSKSELSSSKISSHFLNISNAKIPNTELNSFSSDERRHLLSGKTLLSTEETDTTTPQVKLTLVSPLSKDYFSKTEAIVNPAFLWGAQDTTISLESICVSTESGHSILCSDPTSQKNIDQGLLTNQGKAHARKPTMSHEENTPLLHMSWDLFLRARFGSEDWVFTSVRKDGEIISTITRFENLFVPLSGAAFVFSALICFIWIRKLLNPIKNLSVATKSLSKGDFDTVVNIRSRDELEELGNAFNQMTSSLRYQFNKNDILSLIEHLTIENESFTHIITSTLAKAINTAETEWLAIIVNASKNTDRLAVFYAARNQSTKLILPH